MRAVELFAGAGGAALGMRSAGVEHLACIELDEDAAATLAAAGFPAVCGDVRDLSLLNDLRPGLVWSSFPCQCWSSAGKRLGAQDDRNGWPWTVDALEILRPRWFIAENVTGLTRHRGECDPVCLGPERCPAAYLDRVIFPDLLRFFEWVDMRVLDCASYGVPQRRRRLVICAGPSRIAWPKPTHGKPTEQIDLFGRRLLPWNTPDYWSKPSPAVVCSEVKGSGDGGNPHKMQRASDALFLATGRRRLTAQECAALQDFPPDHPWQGNQQSWYRQVGNAVPPALARVVVEAVIKADKGQA